MASKITIKRSTAALPPAGLSFGELAFVQGTGITANQLYVGLTGASPVWVGAQISTTGSWTDNAAKTSLATQYAIDQRISSQISGSNPITTADDNSNATRYLLFTTGVGAGVTLGVDSSTGPLSYNPSLGTLTVAGDLNVNGGDITTSSATATVFNTTTTNLSIGSAATTLTMGATSGGAASIRSGTITLGSSSSTFIQTIAGTTNDLYISPNGNLLLAPSGTIGDGTSTTLAINNSPDAQGRVEVGGGDLYLGTKSVDGAVFTPVNVIFEGSGNADSNQTTLTVVNPTADRTLTLPDASDTLVGKATIDTFTNKTFDTAGTGNVFRIAGVTLTANTGTGSNVLATSPTITTSLVAGSASFDLIDTTATIVNFARGATALNIGNASGTATFGGNVIVNGDFTVQGNTTTLNTTTLAVEDFNITMGLTLTSAANCTGAGIGIGVGTGITFAYNHDTSQGWQSSVNIDLATGKVYEIGGIPVLSSSALGSGITGSSLTQVGTITSGTWNGLFGAVSGANLTVLTAGGLTGTIPSGVLGNSSLHIGTTSIALNRGSLGLTLAGVSIDGTAGTATNIVATEQTTGTMYLVGVAAAGTQGLRVNVSPAGALEYNVATGELSAALIDGGSF